MWVRVICSIEILDKVICIVDTSLLYFISIIITKYVFFE